MEGDFRVSVRNLVAFTYYPQDITPMGGVDEMQRGAKAHRARQGEQEGDSERPVKHLFDTEWGGVFVFGRMDAYTDGDVPFIEEIKMSAWDGDAPLAEHRAQALCYAAMVALEKPCERVRISVTYVSEQGQVLREYPETLSAQTLQQHMDALLAPYLRYAVRERQHQRLRDGSLKALAFPFDSYRAGQRELARQVYTAITRKKRLFASLPTGTGKSAAVLYPALKALGEGKTGKLIYLTCRNTARQSPLNALERMLAGGAQIRVSTITAKEKMCPSPTRCHPDYCPRAKGHYTRQAQALEELTATDQAFWTDEEIQRVAQRYMLCPFEFALALCELADVALMDLNYAFDPFAQISRLFQTRRDMTLLVDEAHHTVDRVRESLSGELSSAALAGFRAAFGKAEGRKHPYYKALGEVIRELRALLPSEADAPQEMQLKELPPQLTQKVQALLDETSRVLAGSSTAALGEVLPVMKLCFPFLYAVDNLDEDYAILLERHGRDAALSLYCLLPAKQIARVTKPLRGSVFFSATLTPLPAMKQLLGGGDEDACFSLPSPFPSRNLAVVRKRVSTRYTARERSADAVARLIEQAASAKKGKYIAFFPSYAYLLLVLDRLDPQALPPLWVQKREMDDEARADFMAAFETDPSPKLGMCVLGGLFSEGVDLPGDQLIGAIIVGVGLPTPSLKLKTIQACYARHFDDGFGYACRIPAMHKVLQAGGRVIRSETDKGLVLLIDDRYYDGEYASLLPSEWVLQNEDITTAIKKLEEIE